MPETQGGQLHLSTPPNLYSSSRCYPRTSGQIPHFPPPLGASGNHRAAARGLQSPPHRLRWHRALAGTGTRVNREPPVPLPPPHAKRPPPSPPGTKTSSAEPPSETGGRAPPAADRETSERHRQRSFLQPLAHLVPGKGKAGEGHHLQERFPAADRAVLRCGDSDGS